MVIKKIYIFSFIISLFIGIFSAFYAMNLNDGDILQYNKVYNFSSFGLDERKYTVAADPTKDIWGNEDRTSRDFYSKHLTSREITHFVVISFFSKFITYYQFLALLNFSFVFLIFMVLHKYNTNYLISLSLIFTNYYMIVLYISAERLKVGIILGLISILLLQYKKLYYLAIILSILSHFQLILFYFAIYFNNVVKLFLNIFKRQTLSLYVIIFLILSILIIVIAGNHILYKIANTGAGSNIHILEGWAKISIFFILTYYNYRRFTFLFFLFLPFYLATAIVGPDRLVIVVFAIFYFLSIKNNRGINFPLVLVTLYFFIKSFSLLTPMLNCGNINMHTVECENFLNKSELNKRKEILLYLE